ncbi:MAG: AMP-binding protein [Deltaproteobacteria bacterium]|nr:AMP-binding protein [Deltaproteobacteria bacterium]MBW2422286.1 AMP-binding protein [Deltaproteobacteria bacterium]
MRERNEMILADQILARAEQKPDLNVLTFEHLSLDGGATPDEVRSYADLQTNANAIAAALIDRGLEVGDRFGVMMQNHPEFVESVIAASISGAPYVPIDPRTRGEKLEYMLRDAGCRGIICADYCLDEVEAVRARVPHVEWVLVVGDGPVSGAGSVAPLAEVLSRPAPSVDVRIDDPGAPLQVMYTSGTTGDPKGIVGGNDRYARAGMLASLLGYQPDERAYTGLSLTHGNANSMTLMPALMNGLHAVFSRRFTKSRLWEVCRTYGCTSFSLVGGMAMGIYSEPERPDDADNPVRLVISGGMPAAIWESFEKRFGLRILEFYGAMDGGGMALKPVGEGPIGSFGKAMFGVDMRILDEDGNPCPPGVVGEICTRPQGGEVASVEYFGKPEASKKKIRGGWNRSGDMGHADEEGWLFFDYRAGGGIRHNGDFINPSFVEKAIAEHPGVADVFVYGVKAASGTPGEKDAVAAVVFADEGGADPDSVFALCRERLEPNFVPTYLQVVDEIPKTASEKPQERFLLEAFEKEGANIHTASR